MADQEWVLMVEDCETRQEKMSEWEQSFIDSISRRESITNKQKETLDKIWEKVTADA